MNKKQFNNIMYNLNIILVIFITLDCLFLMFILEKGLRVYSPRDGTISSGYVDDHGNGETYNPGSGTIDSFHSEDLTDDSYINNHYHHNYDNEYIGRSPYNNYYKNRRRKY